MANDGGLGTWKRKNVLVLILSLMLLTNLALYHLFELLEIRHFVLRLLNQLLTVRKLRRWPLFQSIPWFPGSVLIFYLWICLSLIYLWSNESYSSSMLPLLSFQRRSINSLSPWVLRITFIVSYKLLPQSRPSARQPYRVQVRINLELSFISAVERQGQLLLLSCQFLHRFHLICHFCLTAKFW